MTYFLLIVSLSLTVIINTPCQGQITLDGTLGPGSALSGPDFKIPAEMGHQVGGYLFHSFGQFNVYNNEIATFTGPNSVDNILGRVTGRKPSTIDGLLRSEIPGANLFLANPAGMIFGPNAKLDDQGSFQASTADFIRLGEAGRFDATAPVNSILTAAAPSAFGFLGDNPAGISIQGSQLEVPGGETLSVVGGDLEIVGGELSAPSGRINVASVDSLGEVVPNSPGQPAGLNIESFNKLGAITMSQGTSVSVSGEEGEGIIIKGGAFALQTDSQFSTSSLAEGGDISVEVNELKLTDSSGIGTNAGDIALTVGSLELSGGAKVSSDSVGGKAGDINITAVGPVTISDVGSGISSNRSVMADAGAISISTPDKLTINGDLFGRHLLAQQSPERLVTSI